MSLSKHSLQFRHLLHHCHVAAACTPRLRREAQPLAEADHAMVLTQDMANHALGAALAGVVEHVAQQQLAIAASLAIRRDDQRELGLLESGIGGEPADAE